MNRVTLEDAATATGTVVVIDVLRAFTSAAVALSRGAARIVLVETVAQARALRDTDPAVLLAGEVDGRPIDGFDLSNSPTEIDRHDLTGRTLVMRTTAGTRGVVRAERADRVVAASFVCARATAHWIGAQGGEATYVVTGRHGDLDGDEDLALAEYLDALLGGGDPDPAPYLARIPRSTHGRRFGHAPHLPASDLAIAADLDRFDVAMPVVRAAGHHVIESRGHGGPAALG